MSRLMRYGALLAICVSPILCSESFSEDTDHHTSIGEIRATLESIPPYLPKGEVTTEIDIFGSTSMDSLAHGWAHGFKQFHPKAEIVISAEGSETVFERLAKNPSSIGMLSRPVTAADIDKLKELGLKSPVAVMVAREALAIFVHRDNPLESITYPQFIELFCTSQEAEKTTWDALGLKGKYAGKDVVVLARNNESGTQTFLREFLFRGRTMRAAEQKLTSNSKVVKAVQEEPFAVAIAGLKCGRHDAKALHLRANQSVIPSDDHAILVGNYPLIRPLTLVLDVGNASAQSTASREFVRYALSQPGQMQDILVGFFPFDPPTLRGELQKVDLEGDGGVEPATGPTTSGLRATSRDSSSKLSR